MRSPRLCLGQPQPQCAFQTKDLPTPHSAPSMSGRGVFTVQTDAWCSPSPHTSIHVGLCSSTYQDLSSSFSFPIIWAQGSPSLGPRVESWGRDVGAREVDDMETWLMKLICALHEDDMETYSWNSHVPCNLTHAWPWIYPLPLHNKLLVGPPNLTACWSHWCPVLASLPEKVWQLDCRTSLSAICIFPSLSHLCLFLKRSSQKIK